MLLQKYYRMNYIRWCCIKIILLFLFLAPGFTSEPFSDFFSEDNNFAEVESNSVKLVFQGLLTIYQKGLSPLDGPSCPFSLSCSRFSRVCIKNKGLALGILMTGDRLLRCNHNASNTYLRSIYDGELLDPEYL